MVYRLKGAKSEMPPAFTGGYALPPLPPGTRIYRPGIKGGSLSSRQAKCARKGKAYVRKHKRKGKKSGGFCRRLPDKRRAEFKRLAKLTRLGGSGLGDLLGAFF